MQRTGETCADLRSRGQYNRWKTINLLKVCKDINFQEHFFVEKGNFQLVKPHL